ncbi:MAG: aminotransferase class I/II-fold pyridoxal phosphate-dependent enzyme [Pirellulales bacterium]|nr:aminotransferase class I/II-fold pyridoxal phosphate-dependent enzyme [Pirellulales bacterium]
MTRAWLAERTRHFEASGIRRVFELAARLKDPVNLSIGQPHFDVPAEVRAAAIAAINAGKNGYTVTQGIPELRDKLQARVDAEYGHPDRQVFITSGTSGGLVLALLALVDPGDEVLIFDPTFVMYPAIVALAGGTCVRVDTYPDFRPTAERARPHLTPRTKAILLNSPANPTGAVASDEEVRALAELAAEHDVALISDEIYRLFCYDRPFVSPARYNPRAIVIDGFSKTCAMTGWRLGFAHGPAEIMREMLKIQQYSFVCAPQPAQWAGIAALDVDMTAHAADYRRKRDRLAEGLAGYYELVWPEGAFYAFPRVPRGSGTAFAERAVQQGLLVIPGGVFSQRDTHFRISYAASDETIERGIEILRRLAADGGPG